MYRDPHVEYQPQHPHLKSNQHNLLDDRFEHSAACGFLDRKQCKQAEEIWKKIMAKDEEDRGDFVKIVDKIMKDSSQIPEGPRLIKAIRKVNKGVWKEYAVWLDELKDKYLVIKVRGAGLYQWFDRDKKKAMWDYFGWLKNVINWSIDPKGRFAGERGPVPTLKDIASANTVGHV